MMSMSKVSQDNSSINLSNNGSVSLVGSVSNAGSVSPSRSGWSIKNSDIFSSAIQNTNGLKFKPNSKAINLLGRKQY